MYVHNAIVQAQKVIKINVVEMKNIDQLYHRLKQILGGLPQNPGSKQMTWDTYSVLFLLQRDLWCACACGAFNGSCTSKAMAERLWTQQQQVRSR